MLNEPQIIVHGHLTADPELRFFDNGTAVAEFGVAQNPRFRAATGEWDDGETVFLRIKVWRDLAETAAQDLKKGQRVTIVGRLRRRSWDDKETGKPRFVDEVEADDVAVSLRGQRVRVAKVVHEQAGEPAEST
jgi:single-strand DNA-binding protein